LGHLAVGSSLASLVGWSYWVAGDLFSLTYAPLGVRGGHPGGACRWPPGCARWEAAGRELHPCLSDGRAAAPPYAKRPRLLDDRPGWSCARLPLHDGQHSTGRLVALAR
jgi:hypothetical protein